jgi:hypothetical protein
MLYAMGLVVAAVLVVSTVLLAMAINWLRDRFEARAERDRRSH